MNDASNPNSTTPEGAANPQTPPTETCPLNSLRSAVNAGTQRARAAAEKAAPKVQAAITGATYWLGYGVSFAAVFSYTLAKEMAPESLKNGCRDGAKAGRQKAENLTSPEATAGDATAEPASA